MQKVLYVIAILLSFGCCSSCGRSNAGSNIQSLGNTDFNYCKDYVRISTKVIESTISNTDYDYCGWFYDEVLYLTQNDYPRSGLAAVKMAYSFWETDIVLTREINNLVLEAYGQLVKDEKLRQALTCDEMKFLIKQYDVLLPVDWYSEKMKFSIFIK
ncbi:MAG: hypothetical protein JEZ07_12425 [Phycisphaerae bacterium]|nr:hypothetical protein [Phycisphaerae bacterium]